MAFLDDLLASTREAIQSAKREKPETELKSRIRDRNSTRPFTAVCSGKGMRLIAELKQASPSKGILRPDFKPVEIARIYEEEGASAVSILTEERYFKGSLRTLDAVREKVALPILRKDFILEEYQVYEARAFGADAILLIAAILDEPRLKGYRELAEDLSLDVLVEVHSREELEKAVSAGAPMIGINNRNLKTFKTDLETTFQLVRDIPEGRVSVSESGISKREDMVRLEEAGLNAVLIGETFMTCADIGLKIRELFGRQKNAG